MHYKTERLTIRPFEKQDREDIIKIFRDEETCRYLIQSHWAEDEFEEKFHQKLAHNKLEQDSMLELAVDFEGKVIGNIFVFYTSMRETVEIGYAFNKRYHGRGFAKEALAPLVSILFKDYAVHRIQANLDVRNQVSAKLLERIGLRREAHFIQDYWTKGESTDSYIYGMLASDLPNKTEH